MSAQYKLWLESDFGDSAVQELVLSLECEAPDAAFTQQLKARLLEETNKFASNYQISPFDIKGGTLKGRPSKSFYILSIDEPELAPAGLKEGQVVRSSLDLSRLLGFKYNMVTQIISRTKKLRALEVAKMAPGADKDRKLHERIEFCLRGVHFCFANDIGNDV